MSNDQTSPEVTALAWVPPFARGFVRDLRVRWALEEIGVLRAIPDPALIACRPNLAAYVARGTARPAFQRAMAAQLADFVPDQSAA